MPTRVLLIGLACFALSVSTPSVASAEWMLAAYGGYSFNGDLTDATISNTPSGGTVTAADIKVDGGGVFGGRVAYFFEAADWFGVEFDISAGPADIPGQSVQGSGSSGPLLVAPESETLISLVPSVLLRYPGERFQPYGGVGFAILVIDEDASPGLSAHLGLRVFLVGPLAGFAEWRYRAADLDGISLNVGDTRGNFATNQLVAGVSWHFGR